MGVFENWPYTNFHDLNLNWIISKIKDAENARDEMLDVEAQTMQARDDAEGFKNDAKGFADDAEASKNAAALSAQASAASAQDSQDHADLTLNTAAALRQDMTILDNRMDNIIASGTLTEGNTELIDIRVGANGFTYQTAGEAVRDQITNVETAMETGYVEGATEFASGSIYTSNGTNANSATNIRTVNKLGVATGTPFIKALENYTFAVFAYNSETEAYIGVLKTSGEFETTTPNITWLNSFNLSEYPEMIFRFVIQRATPGNLDPSEGENILVYTYTDKSLSIENKSADAFQVGQTFEIVENIFGTYANELQIGFQNYIKWDIGSIARGYNTANQYTIRTRNFIILRAGDRIKCPKDMNFAVISFNTATDGDVDTTSDWSNDMTIVEDCIARIRYKNVVNGDEYTDADAVAATLSISFMPRIVANFFKNYKAGLKKFAHRGYFPGHPTNTRTSFKNACIDYFDGIETDVSNTSDDYLMCRHNADIPGYGNINSLPYSTVKDIVVDSSTGDTIPTFSDYLKICRAGNKIPMIEIKNLSSNSLIYDMCDEIRKYNMENNCIIICMSLNKLITAKLVMPEAYMLYVTSKVNLTDEYIGVLKSNGIGYDVSSTREEEVEDLHEYGIACGVWTVDSSADKEAYADMAIDMITTNTTN